MSRCCATSSFEQPAAIRATTSRCRAVIPGGAPISVPTMRGRYWRRGAAAIDRTAYFERLHPAGDGGFVDEARFVPARVGLAELVLVECADAQEEVELVAQVGAHHLRPVRCDRESDAGLDERTEGEADGRLVGECLRQEVRRRADLEHDPAVAQLRHQLRLPCRQDPVADPVGPSASTTSAISSIPWSPPSSPTWIVTPRP